MISGGWIKLHRRFTEWEWYDEPNVMRLFIHCLLLANHKEKEWRGVKIKKGQFITSFSKLSADLGLSIQQVRTAFEKLQKTGEITINSTSKYSTVNVCKYKTYQKSEKESNKQDNNQVTSEQQSNNNQITTTKNDKNVKNEKKGVARAQERIYDDDTSHKPKSIKEVEKFFKNNGASKEMARDFYDHYNSQNWVKGNGMAVGSWESLAAKWIRKDLHDNKNFGEFNAELAKRRQRVE